MKERHSRQRTGHRQRSRKPRECLNHVQAGVMEQEKAAHEAVQVSREPVPGNLVKVHGLDQTKQELLMF